jgi:L-asparaginases, type I
MKKILMIGTGGTIASQSTEFGLTPGLSTEELLSYVPQAADVCEVDSIQVCSIDSTNVTPYYWKLMEQAVEDNYDKYDGFVICHGTDTLAYTAAALSYMIQNSRKPIVITGAQRPISNDITDAKTNLLESLIYASDDESQDVSIVFGGKVIVGTRAKKERAKSFNAFRSVNFPTPAIIQDGRVIRYIPSVPFSGPVRFYHEMGESIFLLKLIPGIKPDILPYLFENYDCIVMESFGVGGIPTTLTEEFYKIMQEWIESKGKIVVMATQVVNEGSDMTVYEVGAKVKSDFNLIEAYDMTLEATITKLMWIMGLPKMKYSQIKEMFYSTVNSDIIFTRNFQ